MYSRGIKKVNNRNQNFSIKDAIKEKNNKIREMEKYKDSPKPNEIDVMTDVMEGHNEPQIVKDIFE